MKFFIIISLICTFFYSSKSLAVTCEEAAVGHYSIKLTPKLNWIVSQCFENKGSDCSASTVCKNTEMVETSKLAIKMYSGICADWHKKYPKDTQFQNTAEAKQFSIFEKTLEQSIGEQVHKNDVKLYLKLVNENKLQNLSLDVVCVQIYNESSQVQAAKNRYK